MDVDTIVVSFGMENVILVYLFDSVIINLEKGFRDCSCDLVSMVLFILFDALGSDKKFPEEPEILQNFGSFNGALELGSFKET